MGEGAGVPAASWAVRGWWMSSGEFRRTSSSLALLARQVMEAERRPLPRMEEGRYRACSGSWEAYPYLWAYVLLTCLSKLLASAGGGDLFG